MNVDRTVARIFLVAYLTVSNVVSANGSRTLLHLELVPVTGFELVTYRLQGGCSTN